jgi:hypothetical protein
LVSDKNITSGESFLICVHFAAHWTAARSFSGRIPISPTSQNSVPLSSGKDPPRYGPFVSGTSPHFSNDVFFNICKLVPTKKKKKTYEKKKKKINLEHFAQVGHKAP